MQIAGDIYHRILEHHIPHVTDVRRLLRRTPCGCALFPIIFRRTITVIICCLAYCARPNHILRRIFPCNVLYRICLQ